MCSLSRCLTLNRDFTLLQPLNCTKTGTLDGSTRLIEAKVEKISPIKGSPSKSVSVTPPTVLRGVTPMTSPLSPGSAARVLSNMCNNTSPRAPRQDAAKTESPANDRSKDRNKAIMSFDAHLKSIITTALMTDSEKKHNEGVDATKSSCDGAVEQPTGNKHHVNQADGTLQAKQPKQELDVSAAPRHIPVQLPLNDAAAARGKKPSMPVSIPLSSVHKDGAEKRATKLKAPPRVTREGFSPVSRPNSSSSTESAESVKNLEHGAHISCTKRGTCSSPAVSTVRVGDIPSKPPLSSIPPAAKPDEKAAIPMPSLLHRTPPPPHVLRMYHNYAAMMGYGGPAPGTLPPMLNSVNVPNFPMSMQMLYNFGGMNGVSKLPEPLLQQQKVSPQRLPFPTAALDKPKRTRRKRCSPAAATDPVTGKRPTAMASGFPPSNVPPHPSVISATSDALRNSSAAAFRSAAAKDPAMFFGEFT